MAGVTFDIEDLSARLQKSVNVKPGVDNMELLLRHYADMYILATNLQRASLQTLALQRWSEVANACLFDTLSFATLKILVQHIYSNVPRHDTGIRLAAIRLTASYRQAYMNMIDAVSRNLETVQNPIPGLHEKLAAHQRELPEIETFLMSEEPLAWELAKLYEEVMRELNIWADR